MNKSVDRNEILNSKRPLILVHDFCNATARSVFLYPSLATESLYFNSLSFLSFVVKETFVVVKWFHLEEVSICLWVVSDGDCYQG